MFLDRLDPKMSGGSSPPEARLSNTEQAVCHPGRLAIPVGSRQLAGGVFLATDFSAEIRELK
jgi:hypothetical protein